MSIELMHLEHLDPLKTKAFFEPLQILYARLKGVVALSDRDQMLGEIDLCLRQYLERVVTHGFPYTSYPNKSINVFCGASQAVYP